MTDMGDRVRLYQKGQMTWPEPELGRKCNQCAHFRETRNEYERRKPAEQRIGKCGAFIAWARATQRPQNDQGGYAFPGYSWACPQFEAK